MRLDNDGVGVRTVPCPVYFIRRHALEVTGFAEKSLVLYEKPNLAFENMIELLGSTIETKFSAEKEKKKK